MNSTANFNAGTIPGTNSFALKGGKIFLSDLTSPSQCLNQTGCEHACTTTNGCVGYNFKAGSDPCSSDKSPCYLLSQSDLNQDVSESTSHIMYSINSLNQEGLKSERLLYKILISFAAAAIISALVAGFLFYWSNAKTILHSRTVKSKSIAKR